MGQGQAEGQYCVWHADVEEKPSTELKDKNGDGDIHGAYVPPDTDLSSTTFLAEKGLVDSDLTGANLEDADLTAGFNDADLSGAGLFDADLSEAYLHYADLHNADLERATLVEVNLFDADLTNITPYGARLEAVQINDGTEFYANRSEYKKWWQRGPLSPPPRCGYDPKTELPDQTAYTNREELFTKAADTYRQFEEIARQNTRPSLQSSMFVLRQDMQRKRYRERGQYLQAFTNRLLRTVFKHGESFARILLTAGAIILFFAGVYWQGDLILENPGAAPPNQVFVNSFLDALYFSTLTFTTLGLGDFQPAPAAQPGRALVLLEAVIGAVLIATFVFVLGRRAAR